MPQQEVYKLGQVVFAVWETLIAKSFTSVKEAPKRFHTRFKRLLEIDRLKDKFPNTDIFSI